MTGTWDEACETGKAEILKFAPRAPKAAPIPKEAAPPQGTPAPAQQAPQEQKEQARVVAKLEYLTDFDAADLPPRNFVIEGMFERGKLSVLAGQGGALKSTLALAIAVAASTGKTIGPFKPTESYPVIVMNAEDDLTEQRRRYAALMLSPDFAHVAVPDLLNVPRGIHIVVADVMALVEKDPVKKSIVPTALYTFLATKIVETGAALIFLDPFVELSEGVNENDNPEVHKVMAILRSIAVTYGVHICIVHHFNKPGTADKSGSVRGGSSIVNAARFNVNVEKLNDNDCDAFTIPRDGAERHDIIKMIIPKANNSATGGQYFFKIVPVKIANGETVASVEQWFPKRGTLTDAQVVEFLGKLKAGQFTMATTGPKANRAECLLADYGLQIQGARKALAALFDFGYLELVEFQDAGRNKRQGIAVRRMPLDGMPWDAMPGDDGDPS